jgi:hypothetical protein
MIDEGFLAQYDKASPVAPPIRGQDEDRWIRQAGNLCEVWAVSGNDVLIQTQEYRVSIQVNGERASLRFLFDGEILSGKGTGHRLVFHVDRSRLTSLLRESLLERKDIRVDYWQLYSVRMVTFKALLGEEKMGFEDFYDPASFFRGI